MQVNEGKAVSPANTLSSLVPRNHKLYHVFNFINENYGNPENVLRALTNILNFDKGVRTLTNTLSKKRFTLKDAIDILRYALPASLYSLEMAIKLLKYIKIARNGEETEWEKREEGIQKLLELGPDSARDTWQSTNLNEDLMEWILKSPKTEGFKILGYYNFSLDKIEKLPEKLESTAVLLEYHKKKLLLFICAKSFGEMSFVDSIYFTAEYPIITHSVIKELEFLIIKNFILAFNTKENILEFKGSIATKRRAVVKERINQFDVNPLIADIRKVLKNGRKRGYAFVGKQGTGKSIIMQKIEEIMTDTVIIRITPEELGSNSAIKRCFALIRAIQPAIVIIEDMDSFRFKEKNERVGTFIKEIDAEMNAVFLVTINDPDMIHRTLMDRPGRFDEVYVITPPRTKEETYEVMKSKYDKLVLSYTDFIDVKFPEMSTLNDSIFDRCLKNGFTQAELTNGIIETVFIRAQDPKGLCFNAALQQAIESFFISKKNLKSYKFNEEDPYSEEVYPVEDDEGYPPVPDSLTTEVAGRSNGI